MFRIFFVVLVMWIVVPSTGWGQAKEQAELGVVGSSQTAQQQHSRSGFYGHSFAAQQMAMRNVERQGKLVSDTNKLLALVSDFNQQMNKNGVEMSSVDMARRVEEIEKLARSVKERMRDF
jgi:hypothetical protein